MVLSPFNIPIGYLYVSFRKIPTQILCIFLNCIFFSFFFFWVVWALYVLWILIPYKIWGYCLHSVDCLFNFCFLYYTEGFLVWYSPTFSLLLPFFSMSCPWNHCQDQCQGSFLLMVSSRSFVVSGIINTLKYLIYFDLILWVA